MRLDDDEGAEQMGNIEEEEPCDGAVSDSSLSDDGFEVESSDSNESVSYI